MYSITLLEFAKNGMASLWGPIRLSLVTRAFRARKYHPIMVKAALYHRKQHNGRNKKMMAEITNDTLGFEVAADLDELTDVVEQDFEIPHQVSHREEKEAAEKLKQRIIARKYFKPPQELNLLTWAAKEQMRFLHREHPEEWTLDKLAGSFPVSREGAMKVLKSRFVPSQIKEIMRHDRSVVKNWKALKAGLTHKAVALKDASQRQQYQELFDSGGLSVIGNANGIKGLDAPVSVLSKAPPKQQGIFLSMMKNYESNKQAQGSMKDMWQKQKQENSSALDSMEATILKIQAQQNLVHSEAKHKLSIKSDKKQTRNKRQAHSGGTSSYIDNTQLVLDRAVDDKDSSQFDRPRSIQKSSHKKKSLIDLDLRSYTSHMPAQDSASSASDQTAASSRKSLRQKCRDVSVLKNTHPLPSLSGFEGTYKIESDPNSVLDKAEVSHPTSVEDGHEIHHELVEKELQIDSTDDGMEQAYVYNPQTGYQFPFGRQQEVRERLNLTKNKNETDKVYRKGNSYFDGDGKFLFKVPK